PAGAQALTIRRFAATRRQWTAGLYRRPSRWRIAGLADDERFLLNVETVESRTVFPGRLAGFSMHVVAGALHRGGGPTPVYGPPPLTGPPCSAPAPPVAPPAGPRPSGRLRARVPVPASVFLVVWTNRCFRAVGGSRALVQTLSDRTIVPSGGRFAEDTKGGAD